MATRNLVPRGNNEGSLGIDGQRWSALHVASISTDTLKVTNIQLKANDNLPLFTKGAGIEDISTNGDGQFVIAVDDAFLTNLGFNADGTKPDFAANGTVLAGDSFVSAINKLDQAVSNVADPSDLDTTNFADNIIDSDLSAVSANDDTLASAKAIKSYVDAQLTAQDLDLQGDAGGALSIDLDSQTLTIAGGTGLTSTGADQTLTLALDDTAVTPGAYGSATAIPTFTVDQQGRLTAAGTAAITTSFTLAADAGDNDTFNNGGTLTFAGDTGITTTVSDDTITIDLDDTAVTAGSYGSATAIPTFTVDQQGRLTAAGTVGITTTLTVDSDNDGTQDVSLAADDLQIKGGTGLTSSIAKADNEVTVTLALDDTAVAAATYGDANSVGQFTVDAQGRLTGASSVDIEIPKGQVTNFDEEVQDLVGAQLVTNGSHTGISASYDDNGDGAVDLTVTGLTLTEFAGAAVQTEAEVAAGGGAAGFGDNDTSVLTAAAIKQFVDAQGFGQGSGDISRVNITAGTGLSGSVDTAAGDHTQTIDIADTAVTAGSYGSATQVSTFTVDQQGRLTAAANANIAIASTSITDFTEAVQDVAGAQLVTNGTHAGISLAYDDANDGAIDLTVSAGTAHIQDDAVTAAKLNTDVISGQDELAAGLAATDELLISDAGTVKRMDTSVLQTYMQNNLTFTTNTDVDVTKANLSTRLASYTSEDTLNIGDADNDTSVVIRGNLTVQGTTTTVDSTTINIQNAFSFEGATDDEFETTLTTVDPTADRTIRLPNQDGFLPVLAVESATKITSTPEELNLLDGAAADTIVNEKAVIYSNAGKIRGGLTGNADTATTLETTRSIGLGGDLGGSANFNGSADITIAATIQAGAVDNAMLANDGWSLSLAGVAQEDINLGDTLDFNGTASQVSIAYAAENNDLTFSLPATINVNTSGNAATATELQTPRSIGLGGDLGGSANFNGTGDITITATVQSGAIDHGMLNDNIISGQDELAHANIADADDLIIHDSDAAVVKKVGVDSLRDHFFGAVSGDIAVADGGEVTIQATAVEHGMLNDNIISGKDELAHADIADADEMMISDAGTIKRVGVDSLRDHFFGAVSGDATLADGGALTIAAAAIEHGMLNDNIISGQDELAHADIADGDDLMIHDSDAAVVKRVGVDSLRDHFFGTVSGDITIADGGTAAIGNQKVTNAMLADDAVGADELAANAVVNASIAANAAIDITKIDVSGANQLGGATLAQDDDFVVYDTSTTANKRVTFSNLEDSIFANITAAGGDATIAAGGAITIAAGAVEFSMIDPNAIKDEDDMASNSASHLATQQSIRKYVDDQLGRFGGIFKTDSADNGKAESINRDVIYDSSPLVRSHFGPFAFDLGQLASSGGSDIIFFGATATGASDRHFLVIGSGDHKGDTEFTGANENTP